MTQILMLAAVACIVAFGDYALRRAEQPALPLWVSAIAAAAGIGLILLPTSWTVPQQVFMVMAPTVIASDFATNRLHVATIAVASFLPAALVPLFHYHWALGNIATVITCGVAYGATRLPHSTQRMPIADALFLASSVIIWGMRGIEAVAVTGLTLLIARATGRRTAPYVSYLGCALILLALIPLPWYLQ